MDRRASIALLFFAWLSPVSVVQNGPGQTGLHAASRPTYAEVERLLPAIWKDRYPIAPPDFEPNPDGRGVLRTVSGGRAIYYYEFATDLPRTKRSPSPEDDSRMEQVTTIRARFFVRYRYWLKEPYDITFAREDLLPGSSRRWIR